MLSLIGLSGAVLGSVLIYLASPNQRWLASAWPALPARAAGGVLLILGGLGLAQEMQPLTAILTLLTSLMLVFAALPYLAMLFNPGRGR